MKRIFFLLLLSVFTCILHAQELQTFLGEKNRMGLKDARGKVLIPAKYDFISDYFQEGFSYVTLDHKRAVIDVTGKLITPLKYDEVGFFTNGFAAVNMGGVWNDDIEVFEGGKWTFIDKTGREIAPMKYTDVMLFYKEGFALVSVDNKWGVLNKSGKEITPLKYDYIKLSDHIADIAVVNIGGSYDEMLGAESFNEFSGGKQGFINCITGKEITPLIYARVEDFVEGLAAVMIVDEGGGKGKWGFIDKTGKVVIPLKYDGVGDFNEGKVDVLLDGKKMWLDKTGKPIK
ncbi:WG repeat-containing protein [Nostoc ellipsosporum NOK]|nr:WG repeat-containing protein [Nostoc ellipsosporum NOK]